MLRFRFLLATTAFGATCQKSATFSINGTTYSFANAPTWASWCDNIIANASTCAGAKNEAQKNGTDCGIQSSGAVLTCPQRDDIKFGTSSVAWSGAPGWQAYCNDIIIGSATCEEALATALKSGSDCGLNASVGGGNTGGSGGCSYTDSESAANCSYWKGQGFCAASNSFYSFMMDNCKKSCLCDGSSGGGGGGSVSTTTTTTTTTTRTYGGGGGSTAADPKVFHYFPAWGLWTRDYNAWWLPGGKASGTLYSFFDVTKDCECLSTDEGADFKKGASWGGIVNQIHGSNNYQSSWDWKGCAGNRAHIQAVKAAHPDYEVLMSLGGWTLSSHFHKCLKTAANREKLAESIKVTASKYGFFSGIDIDWEYPGKFDVNGNERPLTDVHVEVKYWADFLDLLKVKMPEMYHSSALGMNPELVTKEFATTDFCRVLNDLKYVFTMSYDFYGAWSRTTGHNAPMNDDPANPAKLENFSVVGSMEHFINEWNNRCRSQYGAIEPKIVLGMPAYGRTWSNVPSTEIKSGLPGLYADVTGSVIDGPGSITDAAGIGYGSIDFWDVKNKYLTNSGVRRYWDPIGQVPYLIGERTDGVCCLATEQGNSSLLCSRSDCKRPGQFYISYDDEESIRIKTQYAKSKGFAGVMFWEASGDREWDLLNAVYEAWGSSIRVPKKYRPVSSVPEFCGPSDELIPGQPAGTGCWMYPSWYHNNSCSTLANAFDSFFERQPFKDKGSCCGDVGTRTGCFGTKEQCQAELRAGSVGSHLCPSSIIPAAGAGCVA